MLLILVYSIVFLNKNAEVNKCSLLVKGKIIYHGELAFLQILLVRLFYLAGYPALSKN